MSPCGTKTFQNNVHTFQAAGRRCLGETGGGAGGEGREGSMAGMFVESDRAERIRAGPFPFPFRPRKAFPCALLHKVLNTILLKLAVS